MTVQLKIFPIAGLCDATQEISVPLSEGNLNELMTHIRKKLNADPSDNAIMFLHNGRGLESSEEAVLLDGDQMWLLPRISGG